MTSAWRGKSEITDKDEINETYCDSEEDWLLKKYFWNKVELSDVWFQWGDEDAVSWLTSYGSWHAYEKKKKNEEMVFEQQWQQMRQHCDGARDGWSQNMSMSSSSK